MPTSLARAHDDDDLLAPSEAAEIATRSVRTIRRAYSSGRLTAFRDRSGRGVRIRYRDLRSWMMGEEISETSSPLGEATASTKLSARPRGSLEESLALLRAARASRRQREGGSSPVSP